MNDKVILGYLLLACKQLNYTKNEARDLLREMSILMVTKTDEEAEEGFRWYKKLEEKNVEDKKLQTTKKDFKPIKARKITTLPKNYKSKLAKENERLLKLLRSM